MPIAGRGNGAAGEAFWRFSLALYARPGAAAALLALQDRAGFDVNMLLFALWVGSVQGRRLDAAVLARAETAIAEIGGVVAGLRGLRRQLKRSAGGDVQALRRRVLGLELAAERRVQERLAASITAATAAEAETDRRAAADANLALYIGDEVDSSEAAVLRRAVAALMRHA